MSSGASKEQRPGGGSIISHEALNAASKLLSSPPADMEAEVWYKGIAPQLFDLLEGKGELELDQAAAFVIGFGILGRRQYGAPGTAGWKAFVEPMYRHIDPSLLSDTLTSTKEESIITVGRPKILSSSADIARALQRLKKLLTSHPNPALTKRLLRPILLPLWSLASWAEQFDHRNQNSLFIDATDLLKYIIRLLSGNESSEGISQIISPMIQEILDNILFDGRRNVARTMWEYAPDQKGSLQMQSAIAAKSDEMRDFSRIDVTVKALVRLLSSVPELSQDISLLFLQLFRKWTVESNEPPAEIRTRNAEVNSQDFQRKIIEAKLLQSLIDGFPERLVEDSHQVLDITSEVLSRYHGTDTDEEIVTVALSLLNIVLTSPRFKTSPEHESRLRSIQTSLEKIRKGQTESSTTAKNLLMLLQYRQYMEEPEIDAPSTFTDRQLEDRKIHKLAMSYLTALDSPPPVRVQGLELLSGLVKSNSPVLDISSLLVLYSSLLQDEEEYIYLRTIKALVQLSERHPKTVLRNIVDRYVDPQEDSELDQRLRLGEVLLQIIQSRPLAFVHDIAKTVCEGLLFIASRRGHRAKSEQTQMRREKLMKKKNSEAEEAWDGEVPQFDEDKTQSQEDKELMARIVGGWESKRGSEDVRIRTSALAILAQAIEANVDGIPPYTLSTTVDLCIHILTLESEAERGILRRSAILTILSFAKALDTARREGRTLSFGFVGKSLEDVKRVLEYIEGSDSDGLVRRHARDVIESLQVWEMNMLMPGAGNARTGLDSLEGLSVNPVVGAESRDRPRPRIEEIE